MKCMWLVSTVIDNVFLQIYPRSDQHWQKKLQRESKLPCCHWWTGVAWRNWWKHLPQYWRSKFGASRQGTARTNTSFIQKRRSLATQMPNCPCALSLAGSLAHWPSFLLFQNTFVGLTNLGATCYVNTFLQVWFHNLELRRSLYECSNSRAQEHNPDSGIPDTWVFQAFIELGFPLSCFFNLYFQIMSPSPSVSICSICLHSCRTAIGSTLTPRVWSKLWA